MAAGQSGVWMVCAVNINVLQAARKGPMLLSAAQQQAQPSLPHAAAPECGCGAWPSPYFSDPIV